LIEHGRHTAGALDLEVAGGPEVIAPCFTLALA